MRANRLLAGVLGAVMLAGPGAAQNMPMMQGQGQWGMGAGMMGMGCWGAAGHTDGMLAFYKAELAITAAQESVWTPFAEALRKQAQSIASRPSMHGGMMGQGRMGPGMMGQQARDATAAQAFPDALDAHIAWAQAHLADMKALSAAARPLYEALSDDQKAKADQMLGRGMCGF